MTSKTKRTPIRSADPYGNPIVYVPLAKDRGLAVLDAADFDRLMVLGFTRAWTANGWGNCVRATQGKHLVGVARAIMGAGAGQRVVYRDRNHMNLRRNNLRIQRHDTAKRHDASLVEEVSFDRMAAELVPADPLFQLRISPGDGS